MNSGNLMIIGGAEEKSYSGGVLSRFNETFHSERSGGAFH